MHSSSFPTAATQYVLIIDEINPRQYEQDSRRVDYVARTGQATWERERVDIEAPLLAEGFWRPAEPAHPRHT